MNPTHTALDALVRWLPLGYLLLVAAQLAVCAHVERRPDHQSHESPAHCTSVLGTMPGCLAVMWVVHRWAQPWQFYGFVAFGALLNAGLLALLLRGLRALVG